MKDPKQRDSDRDRREEPEPPVGYKVIEPGPARVQQQSGPQEPEEPLRYKVIEPAPAPSPKPSAEPEEPKIPNNYRVIEPEPRSQDAEAEDLYSFRAKEEEEARQAAAQAAAAAAAKRAQASGQTGQAVEEWVERLRKFAESPKRVMMAAGVGLGVFAVLLLAVVWLTSSPEGRYDLGTATNDAAGLNGRLYVEWDQHLTYRLKIEPSDPSQIAGFSLAVGHPAQPQAVTIHLQNPEGFVLCSTEIVLRYDPRVAVADAAARQAAEATDEDVDSTEPPAPATGLAQQYAQEAAREQGKDIFQNQLAPDGQIAAITAQGTIPCSKKAYENTTYWSFTADFPPLADQSAMVERLNDARDAARRAEEAKRRKAHRPTVKLLPFSIEGDDSIVAFDPAHGVIETNGEKIFYFTPGAAGSNPAWQDYPVSIHYRCDRASNCEIMHAGAGALRARLKR